MQPNKLCHHCHAKVPQELKARGDNGPQFVEANPRCGIQEDLAFCSETCFFAWEDTDENSYPSLVKIKSIEPFKVYIPNWAPLFYDYGAGYNNHIYQVSPEAQQDLGIKETLEPEMSFRCRIPMNIEKPEGLRFYNAELVVVTDAMRKRTLEWLKNSFNRCPEYCTEESLCQNGEPCVPGDWHCELEAGHSGLHQHTHTFQWESG